jgi:hypothetical protein
MAFQTLLIQRCLNNFYSLVRNHFNESRYQLNHDMQLNKRNLFSQINSCCLARRDFSRLRKPEPTCLWSNCVRNSSKSFPSVRVKSQNMRAWSSNEGAPCAMLVCEQVRERRALQKTYYSSRQMASDPCAYGRETSEPAILGPGF